MKDALGDRMKSYEDQETFARFLPNVPVIARIDGRCFSKFTKGLKKPFDHNFSSVMRGVARSLMREAQANICYVQSDEINLAWYNPKPGSDIFFGGRKFKMVSQLAALATAYFHIEGTYHWDADFLASKSPTFDARVFQVPNLAEGANVFLWRQRDCRRNAISMVARNMFSHKMLHGCSTNQLLSMIEATGAVYENDYTWEERHGVFIGRRSVTRSLTETEWSGLPPDKRSMEPVVRTEYHELDLPLLSDTGNPKEIIFYGEEPVEAEASV